MPFLLENCPKTVKNLPGLRPGPAESVPYPSLDEHPVSLDPPPRPTDGQSPEPHPKALHGMAWRVLERPALWPE